MGQRVRAHHCDRVCQTHPGKQEEVKVVRTGSQSDFGRFQRVKHQENLRPLRSFQGGRQLHGDPWDPAGGERERERGTDGVRTEQQVECVCSFTPGDAVVVVLTAAPASPGSPGGPVNPWGPCRGQENRDKVTKQSQWSSDTMTQQTQPSDASHNRCRQL